MELTKRHLFFIYTITFYATLFLIFPLTTNAQTVNIPDANLRAVIIEALGKTSGSTITVDDMTTL